MKKESEFWEFDEVLEILYYEEYGECNNGGDTSLCVDNKEFINEKKNFG